MLRTRRQELETQIKSAYAEIESMDRVPQGSVGTLGGYAANECSRPESPEETIDYLFTFHDDPDKTPHYVEIREAAKAFAKILWRHCPGGADRTAAIRKVREAVMTANASVALSGRGL